MLLLVLWLLVLIRLLLLGRTTKGNGTRWQGHSEKKIVQERGKIERWWVSEFKERIPPLYM
jgi:hypothetical protein